MQSHVTETDNWSSWSGSGRVRIGPYHPETMGAVTVFGDYDCTSKSARFYWNRNDPDGGQYSSLDVKQAGLSLSGPLSLLVPRGYTAVFYSDDGFQHESQRFTGRYKDDATE